MTLRRTKQSILYKKDGNIDILTVISVKSIVAGGAPLILFLRCFNPLEWSFYRLFTPSRSA